MRFGQVRVHKNRIGREICLLRDAQGYSTETLVNHLVTRKTVEKKKTVGYKIVQASI